MLPPASVVGDGQVALESHHASARKLLLTVQQQLDLLESGRDTSIELQAGISQSLNTLSREVQTIEELLPQASADKRSIWRRRVQQLKDDSLRERGALDKYATRVFHQQKEMQEREALLQRRNGAGDSHSISIDALAKETRDLNGAHAQLDQLTGNASAVLGALNEQRSSLKGIQRKVLDMASTLGVSNSVIRTIESRQFWDKMLVYGGMLLTLALLWFVFVRTQRGTEPIPYTGV